MSAFRSLIAFLCRRTKKNMFQLPTAVRRQAFANNDCGAVAWEGESIANHIQEAWPKKTGKNYDHLAEQVRMHVGTNDGGLIDIESAQGRVAILLGAIGLFGHVWITVKDRAQVSDFTVKATVVLGVFATIMSACVANALAMSQHKLLSWFSILLPFINAWFTMTLMTRYWRKYSKH